MNFNPDITRPVVYIYRHSPEWYGPKNLLNEERKYYMQRFQYDPFTYVYNAFRRYLDTYDFPRVELPMKSAIASNAYHTLQNPHVLYRRTMLYCVYNYNAGRPCPFNIDENGELKVYDPFMFSDRIDYENISIAAHMDGITKHSISELQVLCRMFSKPFPILF